MLVFGAVTGRLCEKHIFYPSGLCKSVTLPLIAMEDYAEWQDI